MPGLDGTAYHHRRRGSLALAYGQKHREEQLQLGHSNDRHRHKDVEDEDETYGSEDGHTSGSVSLKGELGDRHPDEGITDDEETGLTDECKEGRRERRRRNLMISERIAGDPKANKTAALVDRNVLKASLVNGLLIGLWYPMYP